jgi:hypothetical protein
MSNQSPEIITKYEVLFAARTGVTVLVQKIAAFDGYGDKELSFSINPGNAHDLVVNSKTPVVFRNMQKNHIDAALSKGFIMFYEMKGEDMVRNTLCSYKP